MAMKYASTQTFGGKKAVVGLTVILSDASYDGPFPAVIYGVDDTTDLPILTYNGQTYDSYSFTATITVGEIEGMAAGSWTWPITV